MTKREPIFVDGGLRRNEFSFNMFSQTLRINRSRHTGAWIVEELNTAYGYWATIRGGSGKYALPQEIVDFLLGLPTYTGPKHEAQERYDNCSTCG